MPRLAVTATHPIQYVAPVLREVQAKHGIEVVALYGSDFSVAGYRDTEFGATFRWDSDLTSGYTAHFLSTVANGGAATVDTITGSGMETALSTYKPDVVLLTGYQGTFHRKALAAARQTSTPLLLRAETTDHALRRSPLKNWARDLFLRWLYRQCAAVLPIGTHSQHHYQRLAPKVLRVLAPYCVDTTPFVTDEAGRAELRVPTRASLRIGDEQIAILFSGKLIPKKNPLLLVKAAKLLPDAVRDRAVLVFLGDGELREAAESLAAQTPRVNACFLGFQNQSALSPFYHAADLMVLPSAWGETWGLVVNEALHHGVPVVVSDQVGSAPDLVQADKTGYVFPAQSAEQLCDAVAQAVTRLIGRDSTRVSCREVVSHYTIADAAAGIAYAVHQVCHS